MKNEEEKFKDFIRDLKLSRANFSLMSLQNWELEFYRRLAIERDVCLELFDQYFKFQNFKRIKRKSCEFEFSKILKRKRKQLELTLQEVAERSECSYNFVRTCEITTMHRNVEKLKSVVKVLGLNLKVELEDR